MRVRWGVWAIISVLLFGTVHLMAYWQGRDADDVAGWVALGAAAMSLARWPKDIDL